MLKNFLDIHREIFIIIKGNVKSIKNIVGDYRYIQTLRKEYKNDWRNFRGI